MRISFLTITMALCIPAHALTTPSTQEMGRLQAFLTAFEDAERAYQFKLLENRRQGIPEIGAESLRDDRDRAWIKVRDATLIGYGMVFPEQSDPAQLRTMLGDYLRPA